MTTLLQQFENPIRGPGGETYIVLLHGRARSSDGMWEGWIVFQRTSDARLFATPVETTQSTAEAVRYWATGLGDAYFEGALERALRTRPQRPARPVPQPVVDGNVDFETRRARISMLQAGILDHFRIRHRIGVLTRELFDALPHAHADVVRALEDLEKQGRWLVRKTEAGNDWVFLTEDGVRAAELGDVPRRDDEVPAAPPKNTPR